MFLESLHNIMFFYLESNIIKESEFLNKKDQKTFNFQIKQLLINH